jgi:hypothetical protein
MTKNNRKTIRLRPAAVGSGLVALDVVVNRSSEDVQYFAGGTCGNVLTILSFLGWNSKPVSRLNDDIPAQWLIEDLETWGVDTSLVSTTDDGSTPFYLPLEDLASLNRSKCVRFCRIRLDSLTTRRFVQRSICPTHFQKSLFWRR